jgi:hypothetical protein
MGRLTTQMALSSSGTFYVHLLSWDILSCYLRQLLLERLTAYILINQAVLWRRGPLGSLSSNIGRGLVIVILLHAIWVIHRNLASISTPASYVTVCDSVAGRRTLIEDLRVSADISTELQVHLSETVVWGPSRGLIKVLLEVRMSLCEVHYIFNEESFIPSWSLLYCAHSVILFLRCWVDGWENGLCRLDGRRLDNNWGWNCLWHLYWLRRLSLLSCCDHPC